MSGPDPAPQGERIAPKAEAIAREAHSGQVDSVTRQPYIQHVERVVARVDGDDAKTVAWLHDVVEDNPYWTFERLEAAGIPARLIRPVSLLTRRRPYTYADYIEDIRTAGEPLAVTVKIADLIDHLHPNCPERLIARYRKALAVLASLSSGERRRPTEMARRSLESADSDPAHRGTAKASGTPQEATGSGANSSMRPIDELRRCVEDYLLRLNSDEPLDDEFKLAKARVVTAACLLIRSEVRERRRRQIDEEKAEDFSARGRSE